MELLYLDSYYFYAPIPRVCKLKEVLSRKLPHCRFNKKFKLLYLCSEHLGFSSPISFLKLLTQTIYDETITNITTLFAEGHEAGRTFQEFSNLIKSIFSDHSYSVYLDLQRLAGRVDPEKLEMLKFLVFVTKYSDDAERLVRNGYRYSESEITIDRETALALRDLVKPERFASLMKSCTKFYKLYKEYMLCKTCRILGLAYPNDIVNINLEIPCEMTSEILETFQECKRICCGHRDDVQRAAVLLNYARKNSSCRIYLATKATITTPQDFERECFSCLAKCLERSISNIVAL